MKLPYLTSIILLLLAILIARPSSVAADQRSLAEHHHHYHHRSHHYRSGDVEIGEVKILDPAASVVTKNSKSHNKEGRGAGYELTYTEFILIAVIAVVFISVVYFSMWWLAAKDAAFESGDHKEVLHMKRTKVKRRGSVITGFDHQSTEAIAIKVSITAEYWRFITYLVMWAMFSFAIIVTKTIVVPILAEGPEDDQFAVCGPYNRESPDMGVKLGEGFDFDTQNHLVELFGFANICSNWDYSPARELTAMVYPLFEYLLLLYLFFDYLAVWLSYKRGEIDTWFWKLHKMSLAISFFLCSQFRMIFVCIAYESPSQHTAGFLGLQFALILVALSNAAYIWDANVSYKFLGGLEGTRIAAICYIVCVIAIGIPKVWGTIYIVANGHGPDFYRVPISGDFVSGKLIDIIWMIFNALIPMIIAFVRSRSEQPLVIKFTQNAFYIEDEKDDADTATVDKEDSAPEED